MRPFLLLFLAVSLSAHAQAVAPMPAPVPVRPPPVMTPGYFPGSQGNPVYTPTGAGLPGERVPGTVTPPVPTSKGRILPREPDGAPGLWAADGAPGASRSTPPSLFGVPIPYPDMAGDDADSFVRACVGRITLSAFGADPTKYIYGQALEVRKCAAAEAYEECALQYRKEKFPTIAIRVALPLEEQERVAGVVAHAIALRAEYCGSVTLQQAVRDVLNKVLESWRQTRT